MKKMKKVQLLAATLGIMATVMGIALINNPVQVKATAEGTTTPTFAMAQGAAVRAVENEAGIRWETNVNRAWYDNAVSSLTEDQKKTCAFGAFVTSAKNVINAEGEVDVTLLTDATATEKEAKDVPCTSTYDFENDETFTYYSSIVYKDMDSWSSEEIQAAYDTQLIARSYMKYLSADGETYVYQYADTNDNVRCMRWIAWAAYQEPETSDKALSDKQKGVVKAYFGEDKGTEDFEGYYETALGEETTYTTAYFRRFNKRVGEGKDGNLTISGLTRGTTYTLTLFDSVGNYATATFKYITALLNNDNIANYIYQDGATITLANCYYELAEDIDLSESTIRYYGKNNTFKGTLDGNGKTIKGLRPNGSKTGGLFKILNGTVKNITLIGETAHIAGVLAYQLNEGKSTLENVYIEAALSLTSANAGTLSQQGAIATIVAAGAKITLNNVVVQVKSYTTDTAGTCGGAVFGYATYSTDTTITMTNCYYIAATGITALRTYASSSTTKYYSANNQEALLGDATPNADGTVTTFANGLTGYTGETVEAAKTAFDAAVKATLSEELQTMMYSATTNDSTEQAE